MDINDFKIIKWVGPDMWLTTESGQEIEVKFNDLILHEGNKITTGFMVEFLNSESINSLNINTILHKWVHSPSKYQEIYSLDLEKRNPHAPIIATVDQSKPTLASSKARDVANRFGVSFGK